MKILLLEDDKLYNETLSEFLEDEGFMVDSVLDPFSAYDLAYENSYDLFIFDINLPFEDGLKALSSLRDSGDLTPTIFITSRDDRDSLLKGFSIGAQDYLKKPIDLDELLARVNVVLRRNVSANVIKFANYIIDLNRKKLFINAKEQSLALKPFELLCYLAKNRDRVISYEEIYSNAWSDGDISYATLRVYISELKRYFADAIDNVRGVGYIFDSTKIV
jgi:DNA-binding response OmpR family regulator